LGIIVRSHSVNPTKGPQSIEEKRGEGQGNKNVPREKLVSGEGGQRGLVKVEYKPNQVKKSFR